MKDLIGPRPSDRFIPWYFVFFFATQFVLFGWFYHVASSTYTGLVTDEAYEKGLRYNQVIAMAEQQEQLGWHASVTVNGGTLALTLRDKDQNPLTGASVFLWLVRPVHSGVDQKTDMTERAPGTYIWPVKLPEKGLWEVLIEARKDGRMYQFSQRMEF